MNKDWLWDRKISMAQAKKILQAPAQAKFLEFAALLLSRKNTPAEVFASYLLPKDFCQNWLSIKKQMLKNAWLRPRTEFWQAVYEKVKAGLKKKGVDTGTVILRQADEFCKTVGQEIERLRKSQGLTQMDLAKKLRISQQIISRIESGRQNISLLTLKNIADTLGAKTKIELK